MPRVYQPYPIKPIALPQDEAAHLAPIEWWYYTGHFKTESGQNYGFELTFFKAYAPQRLKILGIFPLYVLVEKGHVAHFALSNVAAQRFSMAERADFWGYEAEASSEQLNLKLGNWYARKSAVGLGYELFATLEDKQLRLTLNPVKAIALHGQPPGIQSMGPGGVSYYMSYTRMNLAGELLTDCNLLACKREAVSGQAWHDHQWGDFSLWAYAGWDWFSLQLDNNAEVMLYLLREPDGSYSSRAGSFVAPDGFLHHLEADDFVLEPTGETWTSEATGAIYPLGWQIQVPAFGIDVVIDPVLLEQEMDTRRTTGIVYWEGAVAIRGTHQGQGYVELTNYDLYRYGLTDETTPLLPLRNPLGF